MSTRPRYLGLKEHVGSDGQPYRSQTFRAPDGHYRVVAWSVTGDDETMSDWRPTLPSAWQDVERSIPALAVGETEEA